MAAKVKKGISLLLALVMTVLVCNISGLTLTRAQAAGSINGHKKIAENDKYALYMKEDYLSIIFQDKATGKYMESAISHDDGKNNKTWLGAMQSALVLTIMYSEVDNQQADLINDQVTKKITYTDDGFSAEVYWTQYQVGVTLEVSLVDDGLIVRIPDESIVEDSSTYNIGTIVAYPFFGHSYLDEKEGYMFIPDGNGALINLDDKEGRYAAGYTGKIYGNDLGFVDSSTEEFLWDKYSMVEDANKILAPVFGMAFTEDEIAYLAVVESGAERAEIVASPNGVNVDYNRIYTRFIERQKYTQPISNVSSSGALQMIEADRTHADLQIHYMFLGGENATYAGMANVYRQYLMDRGVLQILDDTYRTRIDFLGTERESWVIGTTAVTMTTVDDIRSIYEDLAAAGMQDIFTVYKGWQKGGLYNVPITSYKADSHIGGTSELTALIKDSLTRGIRFYLYNDALRINPSEKNATFNIVKQINKKKYVEETYKDVYGEFNILTATRSGVLLNKFANSYLKEGLSNLAIGGIGNTLFSYNYSNTNYSRLQCAQTYESTISSLDEKMNLVLEQPFAYLWAYTDAFLDMPIYSSNYMYVDESVPFLSIVLKGLVPMYSEYVNFEANKQEFFLKLVETGVFPSFYITMADSSELMYTNSNDIYSSQYDVYKKTILEYSRELKEVSKKVDGAFIIGHEILDNNVTVVTYDNGVTIYLNYSQTEQTVDGNTIAGMSYKVVER